MADTKKPRWTVQQHNTLVQHQAAEREREHVVHGRHGTDRYVLQRVERQLMHQQGQRRHPVRRGDDRVRASVPLHRLHNERLPAGDRVEGDVLSTKRPIQDL